MRVLIIGETYFGNKMAKAISQVTDKFQFQVLNTAGSSRDVLKYLLKLPRTDLVFSISATVAGGRALRTACKLNIPILQEFIGCDVLRALADLENSRENRKLMSSSVFFCGAPWLVEELKSGGIDTEFISDYVDGIRSSPLPLTKDFSVLTYVPGIDEDLYGIEQYIACARAFPDVLFRIAGTNKSRFKMPPNIEMLGWCQDFEEELRKSTVFLRLTRHDGISQSVVQALGVGRWVIRTNAMPGTLKTTSVDETIAHIQALKNRFDAGQLQENREGHAYARENFDQQQVLPKLIRIIEKAGARGLT